MCVLKHFELLYLTPFDSTICFLEMLSDPGTSTKFWFEHHLNSAKPFQTMFKSRELLAVDAATAAVFHFI